MTLDSPFTNCGKRQMGENSTVLIETSFLDDLGHWMINKGTQNKNL